MAKIGYISMSSNYNGGFTTTLSITANDISMQVVLSPEETAPAIALLLKAAEDKRIKAAQDLTAASFVPALQDLSPVVEGDAVELESADDKLFPPAPSKSSDIDDLPF